MEDLTAESMIGIRGGFHLFHHKKFRFKGHIVNGNHDTQINRVTLVGGEEASVSQHTTASAGNIED
jgi:hypothetical protein